MTKNAVGEWLRAMTKRNHFSRITILWYENIFTPQDYTVAYYPDMPSKFGELLLRMPELQRVCQVILKIFRGGRYFNRTSSKKYIKPWSWDKLTCTWFRQNSSHCRQHRWGKRCSAYLSSLVRKTAMLPGSTSWWNCSGETTDLSRTQRWTEPARSSSTSWWSCFRETTT